MSATHRLLVVPSLHVDEPARRGVLAVVLVALCRLSSGYARPPCSLTACRARVESCRQHPQGAMSIRARCTCPEEMQPTHTATMRAVGRRRRLRRAAVAAGAHCTDASAATDENCSTSSRTPQSRPSTQPASSRRIARGCATRSSIAFGAMSTRSQPSNCLFLPELPDDLPDDTLERHFRDTTGYLMPQGSGVEDRNRARAVLESSDRAGGALPRGDAGPVAVRGADVAHPLLEQPGSRRRRRPDEVAAFSFSEPFDAALPPPSSAATRSACRTRRRTSSGRCTTSARR